jgi:hypothetical protein
LAFCALWEHENNLPISANLWKEMEDDVRECYSNLLRHSELLQHLSSGKWYASEMNLPFKLDGNTIGTKLDLAIFHPNGNLTIVDWKIGESETTNYSKQLSLYCLAAMNRWANLEQGKIMLLEINPLVNRIKHHRMSERKILATEDFVFKSISQIKALIGDGNLNSQNLVDYEIARSSKTCEYCKFKPLCVGAECGCKS